MNNIKDDRALTETPAYYPLLGAWPSSQVSAGVAPGRGGGGRRRGEERQSGADLAGVLESGVLPPGSNQAAHLPSPGLSLPIETPSSKFLRFSAHSQSLYSSSPKLGKLPRCPT